MSSQQKQIRVALAALLGPALPGVHVFQSPRRQLDHPDMPALAIFSHEDRPMDENADHSLPHMRIYTLRMELRVELRVEDDATDDLAILVRKAVLAETTTGLVLGGLVYRITWATQQWDGNEGDTPMSGSALDFNCYYLWRPEW